ncbi:MAG: hypothetical protein LUQ09_02965 [Methanomassiliicoccales archaeon]|nr:hypothetical protein [Methanomassiliicoccales archaeon]
MDQPLSRYFIEFIISFVAAVAFQWWQDNILIATLIFISLFEIIIIFEQRGEIHRLKKTQQMEKVQETPKTMGYASRFKPPMVNTIHLDKKVVRKGNDIEGASIISIELTGRWKFRVKVLFDDESENSKEYGNFTTHFTDEFSTTNKKKVIVVIQRKGMNEFPVEMTLTKTIPPSVIIR